VSDYETIQKRRNIIVGIFVIVAFCALVWLISKFGDLPMTISKINSFDVRVQFPTAPGVQKDTPVRFCGFQIGRVTKVVPPEVMKDLKTGQFYHQTRVVLTIDRKYSDIPAGVEAKLMTRGLGSSYIELKLKHFDVNEPTGPVLAEGSLLQGSTGMTSEFFPEESQKKLDDLITGLNAFMSNANKILGDPNNKENLKEGLAHLSEASGHATQTLQDVNETMQRARVTMEKFGKLADAGTATLKNADAQVEKLVTAMAGTSEDLSKVSSELRLILEKINSGQGSAGQLLNDGRFYENLLENTEQLQAILEELKSFVAETHKKGVKVKWW
jgi:phospholipid/cholesterol/gamma-HCH transport system substrate-binding protein